MAHIVVLGGSTAGLLAAYEIADLAGAEDSITMIAERGDFHAVSPPPWAAAPSATGQTALRFPLEPALARRGIGMRACGARHIDADKNCVELGDGTPLRYDFLIIANGPKPAFEEIEGFGPRGHTHSICHADHLASCASAWKALLEDPGPVIVGAAQEACCIAPAYETALQIAKELRRPGLRGRAPVTFVTPEPYIGELGLGAPADPGAFLPSAIREAGLRVICGARIDKVEADRMWLTAGMPACSQRLPFKFSLVMPPLRPIDALAGIPDLADAHGFIVVDQWLRNPRYRNIYAAGVAVRKQQSPAADRAAKPSTPYAAASMAGVVAQNVRDQIDGKAPARSATWNRMGLAQFGACGITLLEECAGRQHSEGFPQAPWVHASRCSSCDVAP